MQNLSLDSRDLAELADTVLSRGGRLPFFASGSSMFPTIRDGDLLVAEGVTGKSPERGDVLLHRTAGGGCTVHRLRSLDGSSITMSCDASPWSTYSIRIEDVIGRVVSARRSGRELDLSMTPGTGLALRMSFVLRRARHHGVRAAGMAVSMLTFARPLRRLYSLLVRPLVKYTRTYAPEKGASSNGDVSWVSFNAVILGRTVGSAQLVRFGPDTPLSGCDWLFGMKVARPLRGAGIGRMLTALVIEQAASSGSGDLRLAVRRDNRRALRLYSSMGFRECPAPEQSSWDAGSTLTMKWDTVIPRSDGATPRGTFS
ncbi:MAG: hypothetical protein AVO35_08830 [Candidatus Aegiribacteria sp. MLS_C]|nr:MAG: hypothetical protein AVO35_08830 [Candidatus Aegiribacteria sp. MLS_C]